MACCASPGKDSLAVRLGPFVVEYTSGADDRADEYRLRHQVFVEERGWLPASAAGDGLERDELDPSCVALLLRHASTGNAAACQRFILPERLPQGLMTNVERYADSLTVDFAQLPKRDWAEVSRSAIAPRFRWGSSATEVPALVGVTYASLALAVALGRRTLFSFSDLRTARLTRRLGLHLQQVGRPVDFHGVRAPFRIDVEDAFRTVEPAGTVDMDRLIAEARRVSGIREPGPCCVRAGHERHPMREDPCGQ